MRLTDRYGNNYPKHTFYKSFSVNYVLGINYGEVTPSDINPALLITLVFAITLAVFVVLRLVVTPLLYRCLHRSHRVNFGTSTNLLLSRVAASPVVDVDSLFLESSIGVESTTEPAVDCSQNPLFFRRNVSLKLEGHSVDESSMTDATPTPSTGQRPRAVTKRLSHNLVSLGSQPHPYTVGADEADVLQTTALNDTSVGDEPDRTSDATTTAVQRPRANTKRLTKSLVSFDTDFLDTAETDVFQSTDLNEVSESDDKANFLTDEAAVADEEAKTPRRSISGKVDTNTASPAIVNKYLDPYSSEPAESKPTQHTSSATSSASPLVALIARLRGISSARLGLLDISAGDLLVIMLILLANAFCLIYSNNINDLGYATNFGYLAIGNSLLVVVPATRNSVLATLVCRSLFIIDLRCVNHYYVGVR